MIHCRHWSSAGHAEAQTEEGTLRFTVEDALHTEYNGDSSLSGRIKVSRPLPLGRYPVQIIFLNFLIFFNLLDLIGIGFGELLGDRKFDFRILCPRYGKFPREGKRVGFGPGA